MNLSKNKQLDLLKLGVVTMIVLLGMWFFLIRPAQQRLNQKNKTNNDLAQKIASKKQVIHQADQIKGEFQKSAQKLSSIEDQMVAGDAYLWGIKALRDFEIPEQIEFTKIDPPQTIAESDIPPILPYKVTSFVVTGMATYHQLGLFLAKFETSHPHIRINRLEMEPASLIAGGDERLSFLVEMQVLVRPNVASVTKPPSKP